MKTLILAATVALTAGAAVAQQAITYTTTDSFDDVTFGVENAIIDAGLVVDHVSHVGEMLARTREDVGSDKDLFVDADVFQFCSATVSRDVMEADAMNLTFCPYGIFVAELADNPGTVIVGYRAYPEGPMQTVQTLLDTIVKDALGE